MAASLALVACTKSKDKEASKDTPPADAKGETVRQPPAVSDAAVGVTAPDAGPVTLGEDEKLTAATLERFLVSVAPCPFDSTGAGIRGDCEPYKAAEAAIRSGSPHRLEDDAQKALETEVAKKLLAHPTPQVRVYAAEVIWRHYVDDERALVAEAAEREPDPVAARAFADEMRGSNLPRVVEALVKLADHADKDVRLTVARGLDGARGNAAAVAKLTALIEGDADEWVRGAACESLGELADPTAFDVFQKMLVPETPAWVWDGCFQGLMDLWLDHESASEPAYRRTVEIIGKGPYRQGAPSVELMNSLGELPAQLKESPDDWKGKPWVKIPELKKALLALASSPEADSGTRQYVIESLPAFGVKKKELVAIRKALPEPVPEELQSLAEALDTTIASVK